MGVPVVQELSVTVPFVALSVQCIEPVSELLWHVSVYSARACHDVPWFLVPLHATLQLILMPDLFGEQVGCADLSSCRV